jgi:hypothetical protein
MERLWLCVICNRCGLSCHCPWKSKECSEAVDLSGATQEIDHHSKESTVNVRYLTPWATHHQLHHSRLFLVVFGSSHTPATTDALTDREKQAIEQFGKAFQQLCNSDESLVLTAKFKQLIQDFPVVLRAKFKFDADEDSVFNARVQTC